MMNIDGFIRKIDKNLVNDVFNDPIEGKIVDLTHECGFRFGNVTLEGVEKIHVTDYISSFMDKNKVIGKVRIGRFDGFVIV